MLNGFKAKEVIAKLTSLANTFYEKKNNLYYYLYARQAYLFSRDNETLYNYILACYALKDYEKVITLSVDWLQSSYNATIEQTAEMYYIKAKSYYELRMMISAYDNFKIALSEYIKLKNNQRLSEIDKIMRDEHDRRRVNRSGKTETELQEECRQGIELLKNDEIKLDSVAYIMPTDWLNSWKAFVGYKISSEQDDMVEEEKEKIKKLGPIMQDSLLDENFFLIDPNEEEYYCNVHIRSTAAESHDFIVLSEDTWNFFYERYGGIPIPRFSYQGFGSISTKVEIFLQKLNILLFPLPRVDQPRDIGLKDIIYISKSKTFGDLQKKLVRIYEKVYPGANIPYYDKRLWKIEHHFSMNEAWKVWNNRPPLEISAFTLSDDLVIGDAEVSENDTLLLEFRILKDFWFIESDDVTNKLNRRKLKRERSLKTMDLSDYPEDSKKGITGLQNLGNTCFMNSALQCLSNCYTLTSFFLTDEYEKDINIQNSFGTGGKLALCYADLLKELWLGSDSYFSPYEMKRLIGKFAGQFTGYSQQDSQEFLSYLLDGIHEDINRVEKSQGKEKSSQERESDLISAEEAWRSHLQQNQSRIQELFHGQFKSTITCPDCHVQSKTFESFLMLSVPIPNDSYVKFNCYYIPATGVPLKIDFNIIANTTVYELKRKIATIGKSNPDFMVVGLIKSHKLQSYVRDEIEASQLCAAPEIVFVYEIPEINPKYHVLDETIFLSKVYIYVPAKDYFHQKDMKAFTRLIAVEPTDNFRDIKLKIYKRMRRNLKGYYQSQNNDRKLDLENEYTEQIEKEYNYYFAKDQEDMWPYNIQVYIQYANFTTNLETLDESTSVEAFLKENHYSKTQLSFNLIVSRYVRFETLQMNSCLPYTSNEDQNLDVKRNYNLNDCLALFTRDERLSSDNAWVCPKCKANKLATKKMEIYRAPENLIIHLKRFKNVKYSGIGTGLYSKKLSQIVEFPLTDLDMKKYLLPNADDSEAIYDLYAITNHYGELGGGHYTAYAKNALDNSWYDFNDSNVRPALSDDLVSSAAYILFYKRRK